jgi:hypothetical protein
MSALLRIAAAGGWLAYVINQNSPYQPDASRIRYPGIVSVGVFVGGLLSAMAGSQLILFLIGGPVAPADIPGWIASEIVAGGFTLLLIVGWLIHFLPFEGQAQPELPDSGGLGPGDEIRVHVTGTLRVARPPVVLRRRRAVLLRDARGLLLLPDRWHANPKLPTPDRILMIARLTHETVSAVRVGQAYLVGGPRPGIRFRSEFGPVILDFDDEATRDRTCSELLRLDRG